MQPHPMSLPVQPKPFSEGWTLEDTRAMYEHSLKAPDFSSPSKDYKAEQAWREKHLANLDKLHLAIGQHAMHLASQGLLSNAPHTEHAQNGFIDAWRQMVAGEEMTGWQAQSIGRLVSKEFSMTLIRARPRHADESEPALTPEQVHEVFQKLACEGNFQSFETETVTCQTSNLSLTATFHDWQPSFERYDPKARRFLPLQAGDIKGAALEHVRIPVPSGKMLAADWFRHPVFAQITEEMESSEVSINSVAGCVIRTREYAEKLGVAHVFVGNSSPEMVSSQDGMLVAGWVDDEQEVTLAGKSQGSICTDLWWATVVDQQVLVDLLARKMSRDEAVEAVQDMIDNQASTVVQFDLPPGEYHLYFTGTQELFEKLFDRDGVDFTGMQMPMFVLSKNELPLRAKPSSSLRM